MPPAESPRILVVEGDLLAAVTMQQMMDVAFGGRAAIDACHSLRDACMMLASRNPAALLVDPELPDSHAQHTIATLHEHTPEAAIIAIVNDGDDGLARRCLQAGARRCFQKKEATPMTLHDAVLALLDTSEVKQDPRSARSWT